MSSLEAVGSMTLLLFYSFLTKQSLLGFDYQVQLQRPRPKFNIKTQKPNNKNKTKTTCKSRTKLGYNNMFVGFRYGTDFVQWYNKFERSKSGKCDMKLSLAISLLS